MIPLCFYGWLRRTLCCIAVLSMLGMLHAEPPQTLQLPDPAAIPPAAHQVRALVIADHQAQLSSQMDGRIEKMLIDSGDSFIEGQVLMQFDCREQRAMVRHHQAELEASQKALETQQQLLAMKAASDLDLAKVRAGRDMAQAQLDLANIKISYCDVKAPFAGRVVSRDINAYENVHYGEPLLRIVDNRNLQLKAFVPSQQLKFLKLGQALSVAIDETGHSYAAVISVIGAQVDTNSQTVEVRARFKDAPTDLLAGMSGAASWQESP